MLKQWHNSELLLDSKSISKQLVNRQITSKHARGVNYRNTISSIHRQKHGYKQGECLIVQIPELNALARSIHLSTGNLLANAGMFQFVAFV